MKTTIGGKGELLRAVLNNAPITIFALDSNGVFTLSEGKGLESVGLKPGENVGVSALDLYASLSVTLPNNEIITGLEVVRRVMAGENITAITELRGTYFENQFVPQRDAKGKVIGMISVATDITERMQAENALRESEKRFRALVEKSFEWISLLNSEGKFLYQTNSAKQIYGYEPEELIGTSAFELVHPDFLNSAKKLFSKLLNSHGSSKVLEMKIKHKDNSWHWVETIGTNLLNDPSVNAIVVNYRDITERKRAEEVLRESEEKYRQVVQNIDEIIYAVKTDNNLFGGTVQFVSDQVKNILGYQPDEFLRDRELWFRIIHPEDVPKVMEITRKQFASKKTVTRVYRIQCKTNGEYRWVEDRSVPEINEQGNVVGIFGVVRDITERKKSSDQLQKISTAIEQTADSIMITDQNGIIEYVNSAFLKITGYSREEVIGKTPRILKSDKHSESFYKDFWGKILAGNTYRTKFINRKRIGELYIIEKTITPVKNESDEITHFISTGRDVTEKERIEDELYKNSRILQSYIQYSIAPLVLLDKDFNFLQMNEAYANTCQRDVSEFMGHNHFELYPSDAKADFEKVVRTKEAVRFVERPFIFADHPEWDVTYWDWSLTPIMDKMGEVEFLVFALKDVTQRKNGIDEIRKSREQLRALYSHLQNAREEERTRIAREIHDSIGQSLTGLKMDLSFLENEMAQQEDLHERNKLYGKIQTMYTLLDEMIQSVRDVSSQLRPLILDSLGLVTAIEWQTEEFQKKTGLTCECFLPKEKVELNRDVSTVLFRIFQECLTNIIRHAKATKVSIKLERKENHILLEVQDNGIGIDENVVTEINSLGLLGMKERALVFGGSVDIYGNPGGGTIVTVKIPQGE